VGSLASALAGVTAVEYLKAGTRNDPFLAVPRNRSRSPSSYWSYPSYRLFLENLYRNPSAFVIRTASALVIAFPIIVFSKVFYFLDPERSSSPAI